MNRQRRNRASSRARGKRQGGIALVTAVLLLLLISGTIVSTIEFSGGEYQAGGRARATSRNLYAADSGVQLGFIRVAAPRDLSPFTFTLSDGTTVESRARSDVTAQPIAAAGIGQPPDGYAINVGTGYVNELFDLNVTASSPAGSVSELESKLALLQPNSGGY